ncbi:Phospholipase SGR2 [Chlorella vulgaris]
MCAEVGKATEVPHRGSLLRFCESDSAALEAAYRTRHADLERCWWEEEAELQKGSGAEEAAAAEAAAAHPAASQDAWSYFMGTECADEEAGVLVRSGAYEVDLACRQLKPCYWPASRHRVLRGTWFVEKGGEWVPLKESLAEQLEEGYRQSIWLPQRGRLQAQAEGGFAARLELTTHVEKGLYALFASESEVYLCQETSWGWLKKIGASSTAGQTRLRARRGYEQPVSKALLEKEADLRQEELDEACAAAPVSRLVLVVHGIGQQLQGANVAQDAGAFRQVMRQVALDQSQQGLLDEQTASGEWRWQHVPGRTEVLPVQWRKHLFIEADHLSRQLMPPGIPALRQVLHSTVVEILLFMSHHRAHIVSSLITSLNAAYLRFMRRNPRFKGTVSILSHSLGTVLCYDVLCAQPLSPQAGAGLLPHTAVGREAGAGAAETPGSPHRGSVLAPGLSGQAPRSASQSPGRSHDGSPDRGSDMVVDLTTGSPPAAASLQQEVARLRSENQRLLLQLEVARGQGAQQQQQQQQQPGEGSAAAPWAPSDSPQQAPLSGAAPAGARPGAAEQWPSLQFSVDTLIMLGSPLGCFLALRGVNQAKGAGLGTPACAPLMQLAPGQPFSPDGLPAVRRLLNVYHPYDPVAHRIEPLAHPAAETQRAAFLPLFKGGKRIHLAVQEFSEDVGSAASRFGTSLLSSLAFSKFKGSASYKAAHKGGEGSTSAATTAAAAAEATQAEAEAVQAEAEAAESIAEEAEAARLMAQKSTPSLKGGGDSLINADQEEHPQLYESLSFGAMDGTTARGALSAAEPATSPTRHQQQLKQQQQQVAAPSPRGGRGSFSGIGTSGGASGIARVSDGVAVPGSKLGKGRIDFEASLENQYLSALSAHFVYWNSADVALFVLRAVHGLDVLTGVTKQQQQQEAAAAQAAEQAPPPSDAGSEGDRAGDRGRRKLEPTSPRQHLLALP